MPASSDTDLLAVATQAPGTFPAPPLVLTGVEAVDSVKRDFRPDSEPEVRLD